MAEGYSVQWVRGNGILSLGPFYQMGSVMSDNVYVHLYVRNDALVVELEDEDGFYLSGSALPLKELKEALERLPESTE